MAPAYAALMAMAAAAIASLLVSRRYDPVDWNLATVSRIMLITVGGFVLASISDGTWFPSSAIVIGFLASCMLARVVSGTELRAALRIVRDWRRRRRGDSAGGP
jgi:nicotinamide riboside transporter PnuC